MAKEKRSEWMAFGRHIGTATGWDEVDNLEIILYDFIPANAVKLPLGDISINFEKGLFLVYDEEGKVTERFDAIRVLTDLPNVA